MTAGNTDMFYYNVVINNNKNFSVFADYSEVRDIPLLKKPGDYYMSVIRFSVPGFSIPIAIIPSVNFPTLPTQTPYNILLSYNGTTVTQNVTYFSRTINPNFPITERSPYFYVYTYQHLIDLINNAFTAAFAALVAAVGPIAGAVAPYLTYDPTTQLITFNAQKQFYQTPSANINTLTPSLPANIINVFMNRDLFKYFQGMTFMYDLNLIGEPYPYWLLVEDTHDNSFISPPGSTLPADVYLGVKQQFNTLNNWNSFNSLAFLSKSLPIQKEFSPNLGVSTDGQTQSTSNTVPIITDYIPLLINAGDQRADYVYNANSLYRLIELQSGPALQSIELSVIWIDQYNNQYPILLEPGQSINIKFMFIRKDLYKNTNRLLTAH